MRISKQVVILVIQSLIIAKLLHNADDAELPFQGGSASKALQGIQGILWSRKDDEENIVRAVRSEVKALSLQATSSHNEIAELKHQLLRVGVIKPQGLRVGVITLDGANYCKDDIHPDGNAKKWLVGDPINPESFLAAQIRPLFHRAEGLTFAVVKAGIFDAETELKKMKAVIKATGATGVSAKFVFRQEGEITYELNSTDEFIGAQKDQPIWDNASFAPIERKAKAMSTFFYEADGTKLEMQGKYTKTINNKMPEKIKYTYNSKEIYEGLKLAIFSLLNRGAEAIVGDCGFDDSIQDLVIAIIREYNDTDQSPEFIKDKQRTPCLMSTLKLLPTIQTMVNDDEVVLVLTSNGNMFKETFSHLIEETADQTKVLVLGLEDVPGFGMEVEMAMSIDHELAWGNLKEKMVEFIKPMNKTLGAILCECTELPAYSDQIHKEWKVPVFDAMTAAILVAESARNRNYVQKPKKDSATDSAKPKKGEQSVSDPKL